MNTNRLVEPAHPKEALEREKGLGKLVLGMLRLEAHQLHQQDEISDVLRDTFVTGMSSDLYVLRGGEARYAIDWMHGVSFGLYSFPLLSKMYCRSLPGQGTLVTLARWRPAI